MPLAPADTAKRAAAARALEMVEDGMTLGLGTGSTAGWFVRLLSDRMRAEGIGVTGVATSSATVWLAQELGVPLRKLEDVAQIDLTVDGADEIDGKLDLIKGGGAALLREKIIADASARMVVITDASKEVKTLGKFPLPVEVNPFAAELTRREVLAHLDLIGLPGVDASWRMATGEALLRTDGGHLILDLKCGAIPDPETLAAVLDKIPGVVEHGLFIGIADTVIVGEDKGARLVRA